MTAKSIKFEILRKLLKLLMQKEAILFHLSVYKKYLFPALSLGLPLFLPFGVLIYAAAVEPDRDATL